MTREDVKNFLHSQNIVDTNFYIKKIKPSDITDAEYLEAIYLVLTDKKYKKQLSDENVILLKN